MKQDNFLTVLQIIICVVAITVWGLAMDKDLTVGYIIATVYLAIVASYFDFLIKNKFAACAFWLLTVLTGLAYFGIR